MEKRFLMIFQKDCMGCHACEVACKQEHNLGVGPRLIRVVERSPHFFPVFCHHCTKAPCKAACPADAIFRNEQGIVLIKEENCIGCRACVEACPFGAMQFEEEREVAVKCDLCIDSVGTGELTACAKACPTRCISLGGAKAVNERIEETIQQRVRT